jgi:PAS domain S-box-containing protein
MRAPPSTWNGGSDAGPQAHAVDDCPSPAPSAGERTPKRDTTSAFGDAALEAACGVGVYEWRPAQGRLDWSAGLVRIYGLAQAPQAGRGFSRLVHPADRARVEAETSAYLGDGGASYSRSFRIVRPDGSVRLVLDRGTIERDADGVVQVIRGLNVDLTDVSAADLPAEADRRIRELADAMPQLVWIADSRGFVSYFNARIAEYRVAATFSPPGYDWTLAIHPDDLKTTRAAWREAAVRGEAYQNEHRLLMADGTYRWHLGRGLPQRDEAGVVAWFGAETDVEDLHSMQDRQQVLVAELQHRTRNLIGVVRAVADKAMARAANLADFRLRFRDRLDALARVQNLLSRLGDGERVTFDELIRSELSAVANCLDRVAFDGPKGVALRSSTVQIFAMALHELATNAVKYGAFSQPQGRLEVRWRVERTASHGRPWLRLDWRERGVAIEREIPAPGIGSGRELIERALPYQLGAKTTYVLESDGVHCNIALPVSGRDGERGEDR